MDYSHQMERLLQKGKGGPKQRRILEINPDHELFVKISERYQRNNEDQTLREYAGLLLGSALLAVGSELSDPIGFNRHLVGVMLQAL